MQKVKLLICTHAPFWCCSRVLSLSSFMRHLLSTQLHVCSLLVAELLGPCVGALCRGASHRARVCCRDREPLLSSWSVCRTVQVVLAPGSALFLVWLFSYDATDQPCELACNACLARPGLVTVLRACSALSTEKSTRGARGVRPSHLASPDHRRCSGEW